MTRQVRREFYHRAGKTYTQHVHAWKTCWYTEKKKHSMQPEETLQGFVDYWGEEKTKGKSTTNKQNRMSPRDGKGIATTNSGSKSAATRADEMERQTGRRPGPLEIMADIHTNKVTGQIQDPLVREVVETTRRLYQERASQDSIDSEDIPLETQYELATQATKKQKGRMLGLGNMASYCFPGSSRTRSSFWEDEMRQKDAALDAMRQEMDEMRTAQKETEARIAAQLKDQQDEMKRQMDSFLAQFASRFPPPPPPQ